MTPVARFFAWWGAELGAMVPGPLKARLGIAPERLLVDLSDGEARFTRVSGGREAVLSTVAATADRRVVVERLLAGVSLPDIEVVLRLGGGRALVKSVDLPLATEENLGEVLSFEMERLTPFPAAQVRFAYRIAARRPAEKTLRVDLVVVPREVLAAARDLLLEWRLPIDRVEAAPPAPPLDLAPAEWRRPVGPANRRRRQLMAAAAVLAIAALVSPVLRDRLTLAELDRRIAELKPAVERTLRLQAEVDGFASGAQRVALLKRGAPSAVRLLDEFTRLLPDDTWVSQFNLTGGAVELQGTSASTSALVALLEASPSVAKVRFRTPVSTDPITKLERFELAVELKRS